MDIKEFANGVVHLIANKTITKYDKVIEDLTLQKVWLKAMCIELGRLAQSYKTPRVQTLSSS